MSLVTFECLDCGFDGDAPSDSIRAAQQVCFKCGVSGVSVTFRGPTGGRESFHNETIPGVQRETVEAAEVSGREVRQKSRMHGAFS